MSFIQVDDIDPNLFTTGDWRPRRDSNAFRNTISYSPALGATKIVRFIGTSISVTGGLQPIENTPNKPLVIQFSIDDARPVIYAPQAGSSYEWTTYYRSEKLPMSEHVLTIVVMSSGGLCLLDSFVIEAEQGQAHILPSNGSRKPVARNPQTATSSSLPNLSTSQRSSSNMASTTTVTIQDTSTGSAGPSIPANSASNPASSSSRNQSFSIGINTPSLSLSSTPFEPTTINADGVGGPLPPQRTNQNTILISTLASTLSIVLTIIVVFLLLRSRRRRSRKPTRSGIYDIDPYISHSEDVYQDPPPYGSFSARPTLPDKHLPQFGNQCNAVNDKTRI